MTDLTQFFSGRPLTRGESDGDSIPKTALSPEEQLIRAIAAAGLEPPRRVILDGRLRRFAATPGRADKSGWYVGFSDGVSAGAFGCWRAGIQQTWVAQIGRELSAEERQKCQERIQQAIAQREAEAEAEYALAAEVVRAIWDSCAPASADHPYLVRKGVQPHGTRVTSDGRLVVPLYDSAGTLTSLQYVTPDGEKRFHAGARTKGCFWLVGAIDNAKVVCIAEGFATAASVYETTGFPCFIAFTASNLPAVTAQVKAICPKQRVVVVADNDANGTGQRYAAQCAAEYGVTVVMPPTPGHDANDYRLAGGDLVKLITAALIPSPAEVWSYSFADFARQPDIIRWLVKRWIRPKTLNLLVGPSGAGKSFLAIDWAASVVTGREWFGCRTTAGQVLYLAGEGHYGLRMRLAAWQQYHQIPDDDFAWTTRGRVTASGCDLNTPAGLEKVFRELDATQLVPDLVFVDTLHRFFAGDENSAGDVKTMLTACAALIDRLGCALVLVHHTGWGQDAQRRGRGSSAWRGAVDAEFLVSPLDDHQKTFELAQVKIKDAREAAPVYARLEPVVLETWRDEDGEPMESAVLVPAGTLEEKKKKTKEGKLEAYVETIEAAWWATGEQVVDGAPFVSRNALRQYLIEQRGLSPDSADVYLRPSSKGKLIAELIAAKVVEVTQDNAGWRIVDAGLAASLLLRKAGDRLK